MNLPLYTQANEKGQIVIPKKPERNWVLQKEPYSR